MMFFKRDNLEYEFLPAALEIEETPASPIGRFLIWLIFIIIFIAIGWSSIGEIDEVSVATGKTIPEGNIKIIQPKQLSVVTNIFVKEGQRVKKGDILVELDSTTEKVNIDIYNWELNTTKLERDLLLAELKGDDVNKLLNSKNLSGDILDYERNFINSRKEEFEARKNSLNLVLSQREEQLKILKLDLPELERKLEKLKEEESEYSALYEKLGISFEELETKRDELAEAQNSYDSQLIKITQAQKSIEEAKADISTSVSEYRSKTMNLVLENEKKIAQLEAELKKGKEEIDYQTLESPVGGIIQGLSVTTIGGVLSPAQPIMTIVPDGTPLIMEAMVQNKDIAYIKVGQATEIKFDAIPFQRYGVVEGEVTSISPDAFEDEKNGMYYKIKVKLSKTKVAMENRYVSISPGMTARVEVKTGKRKIISFFLDTFSKNTKETFTLR